METQKSNFYSQQTSENLFENKMRTVLMGADAFSILVDLCNKLNLSEPSFCITPTDQQFEVRVKVQEEEAWVLHSSLETAKCVASLEVLEKLAFTEDNRKVLFEILEKLSKEKQVSEKEETKTEDYKNEDAERTNSESENSTIIGKRTAPEMNSVDSISGINPPQTNDSNKKNIRSIIRTKLTQLKEVTSKLGQPINFVERKLPSGEYNVFLIMNKFMYGEGKSLDKYEARLIATDKALKNIASKFNEITIAFQKEKNESPSSISSSPIDNFKFPVREIGTNLIALESVYKAIIDDFCQGKEAQTIADIVKAFFELEPELVQIGITNLYRVGSYSIKQISSYHLVVDLLGMFSNSIYGDIAEEKILEIFKPKINGILEGTNFIICSPPTFPIPSSCPTSSNPLTYSEIIITHDLPSNKKLYFSLRLFNSSNIKALATVKYWAEIQKKYHQLHTKKKVLLRLFRIWRRTQSLQEIPIEIFDSLVIRLCDLSLTLLENFIKVLEFFSDKEKIGLFFDQPSKKYQYSTAAILFKELSEINIQKVISSAQNTLKMENDVPLFLSSIHKSRVLTE